MLNGVLNAPLVSYDKLEQNFMCIIGWLVYKTHEHSEFVIFKEW